jgi:cytochrome c556
MNQLTSLQTLIDARLAASEYSPELYDLGQSVAASLDAFAMLLPADTNLLGGAPAPEGVSTTAAAEVWADLPAFQQLLRDTAAQARTASEVADIAAFKVEWDTVTQSCTSCHAAYVSYDPFGGLK